MTTLSFAPALQTRLYSSAARHRPWAGSRRGISAIPPHRAFLQQTPRAINEIQVYRQRHWSRQAAPKSGNLLMKPVSKFGSVSSAPLRSEGAPIALEQLVYGGDSVWMQSPADRASRP